MQVVEPQGAQHERQARASRAITEEHEDANLGEPHHIWLTSEEPKLLERHKLTALKAHQPVALVPPASCALHSMPNRIDQKKVPHSLSCRCSVHRESKQQTDFHCQASSALFRCAKNGKKGHIGYYSIL